MEIRALGMTFSVKREVSFNQTRIVENKIRQFGTGNIKLHFGPGPNWKKPDESWLSVDVDPKRGDLVANWNTDGRIPIPNASVASIYGSHVFEHMSIFVTPLLFRECARVLRPDGVMRLILPDARKSIERYLAGDESYELFKRRRERAKARGQDYTLWECMRECFLSQSGQDSLLGKHALAHQNAWDFETIGAELKRGGFLRVEPSSFRGSGCPHFAFEGEYPSEADEDYRSLYVEAFLT